MRDQLVAVITPVFNSARTLRPAILSILHQDYPHIHVLVDDGSSDDSPSLIEEVAKRHSSIVLLRRERRPGDVFSSSNAINAGLKFVLDHTSAEFIMRHDSDDILARNSIQTRMSTFAPDVGAVFSWHDMFDGLGRFDTYSHKLRGSDLITKKAVFGRSFPYHTLIWRRAVMKEMRQLSIQRGFDDLFYDSHLCFHEDLEFMIRMLDALEKLKLSISYVDEITLHQRTHSGGITRRLGTTRALTTTLDVWSRNWRELGGHALLQAIEMVCIRPHYHRFLAFMGGKSSINDEFHVPNELRWYNLQGEGEEARCPQIRTDRDCAEGQRPKLCFIIPAHRATTSLEPCLLSVKAAASPDDEVILVFDGTPSNEDRALALAHAGTVICLPENRGPAAARNAGVAVTTAEIIFFIDADVVIDREAPARAIRLLQEQEYHAVVGAYTPSTPATGLFSKLKNLQHSFIHRLHAGRVGSFWTGCSAIRRDCLLEVGGFDESLRYCEDIALGHKLVQKGKRVILDPAVSATHLKRYTFLSWLRSDLQGRAIPWSRLILSGAAHASELNTSGRGIVELGLSLALVLTLALTSFGLLFLGGSVIAVGLLAALNIDYLRYTRKHTNLMFALLLIPYLVVHYAVAFLGLCIGFLIETWFNGSLKKLLPGDRKATKKTGDSTVLISKRES